MSERVRVDWQGGSGPRAVFAHANGFPPLAYRPMLEALAEHLAVEAVATRPLLNLGPPPADLRWRELGFDIAAWLGQPVIGIGHSMGATALLEAAAVYPDRFKAVVIIEPAMVSPLLSWLSRVTPAGLRYKVQPAKATVGKRDRWPDREAFLATCARSGLYRQVSEAGMQAFADAALVADGGGGGGVSDGDTDRVADGDGGGGSGVTLAYPKRWEAHFYTVPGNPVGALQTLAQGSIPIIGIRARSSIYLDDRRWQRCMRAHPGIWQRQHLELGHLMPLEDPDACATTVFDGLRAHSLL